MGKTPRSIIRIKLDVLIAIRDKPGINPTELSLKTKLGHRVIKRILTELEQAKAIKNIISSGPAPFYKITQTGQLIIGLTLELFAYLEGREVRSFENCRMAEA